MSSTASGKHVTVGALKHFAETYTTNVFNTGLNQLADTVGSGLSISGNTLSLNNSSGTSLDTISLPSTSLSGTTGSSSQPVYLNNGTITACGFRVESVAQLPASPDPNTLYIVTGS